MTWPYRTKLSILCEKVAIQTSLVLVSTQLFIQLNYCRILEPENKYWDFKIKVLSLCFMAYCFTLKLILFCLILNEIHVIFIQFKIQLLLNKLYNALLVLKQNKS